MTAEQSLDRIEYRVIVLVRKTLKREYCFKCWYVLPFFLFATNNNRIYYIFIVCRSLVSELKQQVYNTQYLQSHVSVCCDKFVCCLYLIRFVHFYDFIFTDYFCQLLQQRKKIKNVLIFGCAISYNIRIYITIPLWNCACILFIIKNWWSTGIANHRKWFTFHK